MNQIISPSDVFARSVIIPVMVIEDVADALPMAQALADGGLSIFEVTLRTKAALSSIQTIRKAMPQALVGAGSVLNCKQYDAAVQAGAQFIISPGYHAALLAHANLSEIAFIPGVATASEIMTVLDAGFDHLKFFPAQANGGANALKALCGPLPQVKFCPTGGVNLSNAADYLSIKNVATVGGSWILPADKVNAKDWDAITQLTKEAIAALSSKT